MDWLSIILAGVYVGLVGLFILRKQLTQVFAVGLRVLAVVSFAAGITAIFVPQLYQGIADQSLKQIGTYGSLVVIDTQIERVTNLPGNILDQLREQFQPSKNEADNSGITNPEAGVVTNAIYPGIVDLIAGLLRVFTILTSVFGLIASVYFSYSFAASSDVAALERRVAELETKQL